MKIYIPSDYNNKKLPPKELRSATKFMTNILFEENKANLKNLRIEYSTDPEDAIVGNVAYVMRMGKNSFFIWFRSSRNYLTQLKSIAHELTHVKQYIFDGFAEKQDRIAISKGQDAYWDSPFEIEAYGREEGLVRRFLASK